MGRNKFFIVGILVLLGSTLFLSFVGANGYMRLCLNRGQSIPNSTNPVYTCNHDLCMICVNENYYPAAPYRCNDISGCSPFGNGSIDTQSPNLSVYSPAQNAIYTERSIMLDLAVNEETDIYYYDNIEDRGMWTRVCTDCLGYSRERSFDEGLNNLTFKAVDAVGNEAFVNRAFFVDSKKPKIKKTEPRSGFASGEFYVEIQEANPSSLVLHYGDANPGMRTAEVDLETCEDIKGNSQKKACNIFVPLIDYDGQEIEYWFNVTDIAGNSDESKHLSLDVDTTAPVLDYFNYIIDGRYVTFNMSITEENFDVVEYFDNSEARPRWRNLCSRLRDGWCVKKKSFSVGLHFINIQITDEAGNAIGFPVPPIMIS